MERTPTLDQQAQVSLPLQVVGAILNCVEQPMLLADASGRVCAKNAQAERFLKARGLKAKKGTNLFADLFHVAQGAVLDQMRSGEREVNLPLPGADGKPGRARLHWIAEVGWVAVTLEATPERSGGEDAAMQQTLGDLLQEREVT